VKKANSGEWIPHSYTNRLARLAPKIALMYVSGTLCVILSIPTRSSSVCIHIIRGREEGEKDFRREDRRGGKRKKRRKGREMINKRSVFLILTLRGRDHRLTLGGEGSKKWERERAEEKERNLRASFRKDPVPQLEVVPQGRGLNLVVQVVDLLGEFVREYAARCARFLQHSVNVKLRWQ
jgi:hypothetical protein